VQGRPHPPTVELEGYLQRRHDAHMVRGPQATRRAIGRFLTHDVHRDGVEAAHREHEVDSLGQGRAWVVQVDCVAAAEATGARPGVDEAGTRKDPGGARVASRAAVHVADQDDWQPAGRRAVHQLACLAVPNRSGECLQVRGGEPERLAADLDVDRRPTARQRERSLRRVARGGTAMDPAVVGQLLGRTRPDDPIATLTDRERSVLELMAEGRSNARIGHKLFLSPKTVETHVHAIFSKLDLAAAPDDQRRVLAVLAFLER
jgi:DNA-binding CsgD family transcriptional regulator